MAMGTEKQRIAQARNQRIRQLRMLHGVINANLDEDLKWVMLRHIDEQLTRIGANTQEQHVVAMRAKWDKDDAK